MLSMTSVDVDIYLISVKQFTFSSGLSLCTSLFELRFFSELFTVLLNLSTLALKSEFVI